MGEAVIQVREIGKCYRVGEREQYLALRDVLTRAFTAPFARRKRIVPEHIWALRGVSLDVQEGEVVGLIGRNGAGKTTLLKLLARITRPTEGYAEVRGRVGSLLEVGTGFHPELTGRENVYLSGAILGMRKTEIDRKFDQIVAFSEVERFLDTALKHYSSGMQMRLAFAVAAHLDPEILLVDEVLAVGDLNFQKKCLGKMEEVSKSHRTIIFVSHQMNQIRRLCQRVVWIDGGRIREAGSAAEVVAAYESAMSAGDIRSAEQGRTANSKAHFVRWEITEPCGDPTHILRALGAVKLKIVIKVNQVVRAGHHGVSLYDHQRQLVWGWAADNVDLAVGTHELCYRFPMLPLRPGPYTWLVSLWESGSQLDAWECLPEMIVNTEHYQHPRDEWSGVLNLPFEFRIRELEGMVTTSHGGTESEHSWQSKDGI